MPRRIALAIALALTVVTTFSIVVVGARTGLFGGQDSAGAEQQFAVVAPPTDTPQIAQPAQPQQAAPSEPIYVTEYVYRDEQAPATQPRVAAAATNSVAPTVPARPTDATNTPVKQPTLPPAAAPTAPAVAPTQPAAQPTTPAEAPTTPPPPVPTTPPAAAPGPSELEFSGTVTTISGSMVTFSHGGTNTIVKVTIDLNRLHVGSTVKVHAIWVPSGYYVAKELEFGG